MIYYYITYGLVGIFTLIWFVKVVSTYNDKTQDDEDFVIGTLLGFLVGLIWPISWCYVALFGFAKHIYKKSKAKAHHEEDERRRLAEEKYNEEAMVRARTACVDKARPKSTEAF